MVFNSGKYSVYKSTLSWHSWYLHIINKQHSIYGLIGYGWIEKEEYSDYLYDLRNIKHRCFNIKKSLFVSLYDGIRRIYNYRSNVWLFSSTLLVLTELLTIAIKKVCLRTILSFDNPCLSTWHLLQDINLFPPMTLICSFLNCFKIFTSSYQRYIQSSTHIFMSMHFLLNKSPYAVFNEWETDQELD